MRLSRLGSRTGACAGAALLVFLPALTAAAKEPQRQTPGKAGTARPAPGVRVILDSDDETVVLEAQAPDATGAPVSGSGEGAGTAGAESEAAEVPLPLDDGRWDVMCSPPCKRRLPRGALYRITGAGLTTSPTFSLPARQAEVTLEVETGTARWYWLGAIAAIAGGTFVIGSVVPRLAIGGSFSTVEKVMAGTGVVLVGGGGALWWFNRTRVNIF